MHLCSEKFGVISDLVKFVNKKALGKTDIVKIQLMPNAMWILVYWGF